MERLFDWIPAPAPDSDPGFAGMTVHTNNRKPRSIEDSLKLALMGRRGRCTLVTTVRVGHRPGKIRPGGQEQNNRLSVEVRS